MQVVELLHKLSEKALSDVHRSRREAVWCVVGSLLRCRRLWLTALGRGIGGEAKEKHSIKRVDRLLGNRALSYQRRRWYQWMSGLLLGGVREPVIIVDWSNADERQELHILRATLALDGRALTLYEEVHRRYAHPQVHRRFIERLAKMLPHECKPIIITDAGFRGPWFELIESMKWHYVGRVLNRDYVRAPESTQWQPNKTLRAQATQRPKACGAMWVTRSRPWLTHLYVYKGAAKGRVKRTRKGHRATARHTHKSQTRGREPWLLASNLPENARRVVNLYRTRTQIEQTFRDLKAPRHGYAFRQNMGRNPERIANLLLLAALAMLATWLVGLHGVAQHLHHALQANTERRRRVLSIVFVGARLLDRALAFDERDLRHSLQTLQLRLLDPVVKC